MDAIVLQILNGLDKGGAYALIALGLTLVFGTLGVVNFAHGAIFMLGAFCAVTLQKLLTISERVKDESITFFDAYKEVPYLELWFGDTGRALINYSVPLSILLAIPVMLAVGIAMERGLIRFFYKRPHAEQILVTFGLAIVLQEIVKSIFGANPIPQAAPAIVAGSAPIGAILGLGDAGCLSVVAPDLSAVLAGRGRGRVRVPAADHLRHGGARGHGRSRDRRPAGHQHPAAFHHRLRACRHRRGPGWRDVHADSAARLSHGHGFSRAVLRRGRGWRHGGRCPVPWPRASCLAFFSPLPR